MAVRRPSKLRLFLGAIWREYYEISELGLPGRHLLNSLFENGRAVLDPNDRIVFPPILHGGGGTRTEELMCLAAVAHVLKPECILEIGTFTGLTTALFVLNCPQARVISLDLPPDDTMHRPGSIATDLTLIHTRKVGHYLDVLGLRDRYEQIYCDSFQFDPAPLADSVDLAFIDGGHHYECVVNDTEKIARMIRDSGVVLWHDYGGSGDFLPLRQYLEALARGGAIYRIPATSLAWSLGKDLKQAVRAFRLATPGAKGTA